MSKKGKFSHDDVPRLIRELNQKRDVFVNAHNPNEPFYWKIQVLKSLPNQDLGLKTWVKIQYLRFFCGFSVIGVKNIYR